jgi:signal transduction histidine kinase
VSGSESSPSPLVRRAVTALGGDPWRVAVLVGVATVAIGLVTWLAGGTKTPVPQLVHLVTVTAAVTRGPLAGGVAGAVAGLALGPLMPLDVATGEAQSLQGWILRLVVYVLVGVTTGALSRAVRHADTNFRDTMTRLPVAVVGATSSRPDGVVTYANEPAVEMFGDMVGQRIAQVFEARQARTPDGNRFGIERLPATPAAVTGGGVPARLDIVDPAGHHRSIQIRAFRATDGQVVAAVEDLTAEARFERSRRHLVTLAGHHLRTPLTPLVGFGSLLAEHAERTGDDTLRQYSAVLGRSAARLHTLVDRLTQLARLQPAMIQEYRSVDVNMIVGVVMGALDDRVQTGALPGGAIAFVVPDHARAAIEELVDNALVHGRPPVRVEVRLASEHVEVVVSDAGPGLPDSIDLDELFLPFTGVGADPETGAPNGQGLGLALALSHCHATRAELDYDRRNGSFVVRLPRDPGDRRV